MSGKISKVSRSNVQTEGGLFQKIQTEVFSKDYLLSGQISIFPSFCLFYCFFFSVSAGLMVFPLK